MAYPNPIYPSVDSFNQPMYPSGNPYGQPVYPSGDPYSQPVYPPVNPYNQPAYPSVDPYNPPVCPYDQPVCPSGVPYGQPLAGVRRYQIRQRIFSFGDKFTVRDEQNQPVFNVRGKVFSLGRKLSLEDMCGNGLTKIHQELLHLHRTYKILSGRAGDSDRQLAVVKENFSFFHEKFSIESVYGQYFIEGMDIVNHAFVITKQGQVVGTVSRKFFSLADTYGVEISTNEDQAFILSLAIVIDQVIAEKEQNQRNIHNNNNHHHHHHHSPHHHH